MPQVFVIIPGLGCRCYNSKEDQTASILSGVFRDSQDIYSDVYIINNGKVVNGDSLLHDGETYHIIPRVLGGKGGFGSMLRALGAQIEKTTNREACRDLSGRRMRDVNNEQKLRDWVSKASDREKEKDQRRRDRLERRKSEPKHSFEDPNYTSQKLQVTENLEDALREGLGKGASSSATCTVTSAGTSRKRKSEEPGPSGGKKANFDKRWLGVDFSDSDDNSEEEFCPRILPLVHDSGAGSGASTSASDHDGRSDSGVDSVSDGKKFDSPMDVDSDSSRKDSAMSSDIDVARADTSPDVDADMQPESSTCTSDTGSALEAKGLLATLACHPPHSEQADKELVDPADVDIMSYQSVSEIEALGLDTLKAVLMSRGMKCGGTLQQRAERLWAVRGLAHEDVDPSLLAKPQKGKGKGKKK